MKSFFAHARKLALKCLLLFLSFSGSKSSAENWSKTFIFKVEGRCQEFDRLWFQELLNFKFLDLGTDGGGHNLLGRIALQVFNTGRYWLRFEELAVTSQTRKGIVTQVINQTELNGQWRQAPDGSFIFDGLGTADPLHFMYDGTSFDGLFLLIQKDFGGLSAGRAQGQSVLMKYGYSAIGPQGKTRAEYCQKP